MTTTMTMRTRKRKLKRNLQRNPSPNSFGMYHRMLVVAVIGFTVTVGGALEIVGGNLCDTNDFGSLFQEIVQSRDATIFQGQVNIASGENEFMVGTTKNGIRRGLLAFDFAPNDFPSDAKVECAEIRLQVSRKVSQNDNDSQTQVIVPEIKLHRITKHWETSGSHRLIGVNGGSASDGDVTWGYAKYPLTLWDKAGGDFDDKVVATKTETGSVHSWGNTLSMTRLVQEWIQVGGSANKAPFNAGFMLVGEENDKSEKYVHYNGIENAPDLIPRLIVTYTSPSQGKEHREYTDYASEDGDSALGPTVKSKNENNNTAVVYTDLLFFLAGTMFCGLVVISVICLRNRKGNKPEEPDPAIPNKSAAELDPAEEEDPAPNGELA